MGCLKCGKETRDEQVFCPRCMELMEAYPVKADMHIHLPHRALRADPGKASRKRRPASPEEKLKQMRKRQRWLIAAIAALLVLIGLLTAQLIRTAAEDALPEQNKHYTYSSISE